MGDLFVLGSLIAAIIVYVKQRHRLDWQRKESTLAHLKGVKASLEEWYDSFFNTTHEGTGAEARAFQDEAAIRRRNSIQSYLVAPEAVATLIETDGTLWTFSSETVRSAGVALSRVTIFNQLVQGQTDFNLLHAGDRRGDGLERRYSLEPRQPPGQRRSPQAIARE